MKKVLCFGELLLRLSPVLNGDWLRKHNTPIFPGGAELNVAMALSRWGLNVKYITVLPDHYLSKEVVTYLQQQGVDTTDISYAGKRIGTYYLPIGQDLRHTDVIYDREYSAFAEISNRLR